MNSMAASRLRSLLYGVASNRRLLLHRFASSSRIPEMSTASPRNRTANVFEDQSEGGRCAAYNHSVRYTRPCTIYLHQQLLHLRNSVSLIGTVYRTPTVYNKPSDFEGEVGVYLLLSVKSSPHSNSSVRVFVEMWDEIAKKALEHVKHGDYIYVSGSLESYTKRSHVKEYKVVAKELNFVKQHDGKPKSHEIEDEIEVQKSKSKGELSTTNTKQDRFHLWQVFFANPMEWYDKRQEKSNTRSPDFKHKSTGEALWINPDDPPWIKKQLELYDTMVASGCFRNSRFSRHSDMSSYMSDDLV